MNRHNLPFTWHAATDMSAIGWVMIPYSSNCLISPGWLASLAEGDSIINSTSLYCKKSEKGIHVTLEIPKPKFAEFVLFNDT